MSRGNTIFGHKYKNNSRPKIQPKILKSSAVSQSISQNIIVPKKKLDVIIVSVDYNDFLILTLEHNKKIFDNITVVTSSEDTVCQDICQNLGIKCIVTDIFYKNNLKFNKGGAINVAIKSLDNPELILILDADVIVTDLIDTTKIENDTLYTSDRYICLNFFQYNQWSNKKISTQHIGKYERDKNYGFFQLYNFNNSLDIKYYPYDIENSLHPDLKFSSLFPKKTTIAVDVVHLGDIRKNWNGRTSEKFMSDDIFFELFDKLNSQNTKEIISKEISICKYGKFKIENQIIFHHHHSGWSYALETLRKVNNSEGVRLECFLDKNFCWINSKKETIEEDWVGILHNPIESPKWYLKKVRNINLFDSTYFLKSIKNCKGLYVFSENEKKTLYKYLNKIGQNLKINVLRHPIKESTNKWSFEKFCLNKKIIHIGWWLRDIQSFYELDIDINKVRIKLDNSIESKISALFELNNNSVTEIENLNEQEYDNILCNSIVFINLIDSVVNNTVLECIERNTPILINRNASIEEYIGKDYPLFYDNISEIKDLISYDNLIKANLHLKTIQLSRDLGSQIQSSKIYKSLECELEVTEIMRPGDLPNSEGGIYNPGFCKFRKKNFLISRVEKFTEKERGYHSLCFRTTSVPYLSELNENFEVINSFELRVEGDYNRIEDFRIFTFRDKLYSNHITAFNVNQIYPVLSEIDLNSKSMKILGQIEIDFKTNRVEKNWVFFEKNDELFLIYSLSPWIIFKIDVDNLKGTLIKNYPTKFNWNVSGFISSSTNPVNIKPNLNIMGFHSRDKNCIYHQGFVLFDDKLDFINSSTEPYISGGDYDTIHPNVIYTSSMTIEGENLILFAGDGDTKTLKIEVKNTNLWKTLL